MNTDSRIVRPSLELERRTRALNIYLIPFTAMISMFTVSLCIGGAVYAFLHSYLKLPVNHMEAFIIPPVAVFILSIGLLIKFCLTLMTSYKLEDGRITKGIVAKRMNMDGSDPGAVAKAAAYAMFGNAGYIFRMIRQNMLDGFADIYFDTDVYKKREYNDPVLVKETKRKLVYKCEDGKMLRIPKIYEGLCEPERSGGLSFIARLAIVSAAVFMVALSAAACDLAVLSHKTKTEYAPAIAAAQENMAEQLEEYGYELSHSSTTYSTYTKTIGDRTSEVRYKCDKNGNTERVDVQLYFSADSVDIDGELRAVIDSMNADFDENDVDAFITAVKATAGGEYQYCRLTSDKYALTVGTSGEYADVH